MGARHGIPLVCELLSAEFGQAPAIDTDPKTAVAGGAARFLAPATVLARETADTVSQLPAVPPERPQISTMLSGGGERRAELARHHSHKRARHHSHRAVLSAAVVLLLLTAGAVTALRAPKLANLFHHSTAPRG